MSRVDQILKSSFILFGNKVSHSNRKTRRKFSFNIQTFRFYSNILKKKICFNSTPSTLRTITKHDGIDNFLLGVKNIKLSPSALKIKKKIIRVKNNTSDLTD